VYEVYCTIEAAAELEVAIPDRSELMQLHKDVARHGQIYEEILETLKNFNVEHAQARNAQDRADIMEKIRSGPGVLKTNLLVTSSMSAAIEQSMVHMG